MKTLLIALLSLPAWSQTPTYVCDQVDLVSKKLIPGTALEVELSTGKAAHIYSGKGKERELKTSLKFKSKSAIDSLLLPKDVATEIKNISGVEEAFSYVTTSDRGTEHFIVVGPSAFHGYQIDRSNPAIKAALERGATIENHYFQCKPKS